MSLHETDDTCKRTPLQLLLPDEAATMALGARLARALAPGLLITLSGELGSGKTTLVRALLRALGYAGRVKSPTYALVELYNVSSLYLYHFDFYRLGEPGEWLDAGFRDYFDAGNVCLVEWPEKAGASLPPADLSLRFEWAGEGRCITLCAETAEGRACLKRFESSAG